MIFFVLTLVGRKALSLTQTANLFFFFFALVGRKALSLTQTASGTK